MQSEGIVRKAKFNLSELFTNTTMFPSKSLDYSGDIKKLFPKSRNFDTDSSYFGQSSFQTPIANRSSSSADSISPESYFESSIPKPDYFNLRTRSHTPKNVYETPRLSYESPSIIYRQYASNSSINEPTFDQTFDTFSLCEQINDIPTNSRQFFETPNRRRQPIIGRKILGRNLSRLDPMISEQEIELELPKTPDTQKSYELFPSEKGFQFSTPTKTENEFIRPTALPMFTPKDTNWSLNVQQSYTTPYNPGSNSQIDVGQGKMCSFCRKNGETPIVYMTHCVKEKQGSRFIVTCPILRSHVCPICNLSGDEAHTITYCPVLRKTNDGKPLTSTTITLKNTRIKSNGRRRY